MYSEAKLSKTGDKKTVGNSGVYYSIVEYNTVEGVIRQLRIDLKSNGKVVLESGTLQAMDGSISLGKEDVVKMPGGDRGIPDDLKGYFKPLLEGNGEVLLNPTKRYLSIISFPKRTNIVLERGSLLACDGVFSEGGYDVVTSWNKNLRSKISNYRDITTTAIKGVGAVVLELDIPKEYLVEITVSSPLMMNEDAVVMRTSGVRRVLLDEEKGAYFNGYSGVEGRGVMYKGEGKIWAYPGNTLPSKTDNLSLLNNFRIREEVTEDEEVEKRKGVGFFDKRR